jgi:cell division protein FtsI/penicillin-binding protein 2
MNSRAFSKRRVSPGLLRIRFQFLLLFCLIWFGVILLRLVFLQVIRHDDYVLRANKQRQSIMTLYPERGPILDRNGKRLAISIAMTSIYAIPEEIPNRNEAWNSLSSILGIDSQELRRRSNNKSFLWVDRKISDEKADAIKKLKIPGIYFTRESRRYYPSKDLAAHVLGFVGVDNKGLSGVEYQYENVVSGIPGKVFALRDAKRRLLLADGENSMVQPTVGRTLQLTIDGALQHIAERELRIAIEEQQAAGGSVIIMDPYTGEILALANEPSFNPNAYKKFDSQKWKNRAIQDYYEPGSTFKPVVAAAALDLNLVHPDDMFDCQYGSIVLAGHLMRDHKPFGTLSFQQIIQKSSNVGMIKVGLKVGPESLFRYANLFGFGKRTGIDLPAESPGIFRSPKAWSGISIGAISIGQEIGVTPLQVLRMMTAIANGGTLITPHCLSRISDGSGELKRTVFAAPQNLPISHRTFTILQEFVEGVVQNGSGIEAQIPGYRVAGKTGTAQKIGRSGSYSDGGYIASFVGYAPANRPVFSMIIRIDEPKKEHYGGRVAAPLFRKIGQQVLKYLDIPPDQIDENPALQAKAAFPRGSEALYPEDFEPVAYTPPPDQHHKLAIAPDDGKVRELVMPSLFGKTARETVEALSRTSIPFRLMGSGTVLRQWPIAGALLNKDDVIIITLSTIQSSPISADLNAARK